MDQKQQKSGQQSQHQPGQSGQPKQGGSQRHDDEKGNQVNRDPAEGSRDSVNNRGKERGTGNADERNSGGISNRGMGRSSEQHDLPSRGSRRDSER